MNTNNWRRTVYFSMILIALGVTLTTTMNDTVGAVGIVMLAVGGLFFILGMAGRKRDQGSK